MAATLGPMPFRAVLVAAALAAALAGCGMATTSSKSFTGAEQAGADKIGDLQTAARGTKPADICDDILSARLKARSAAGGKSCEAEMRKALKDTDEFDLDVRDVSISGATATAQVRQTSGNDKVTRTLQLA